MISSSRGLAAKATSTRRPPPPKTPLFNPAALRAACGQPSLGRFDPLVLAQRNYEREIVTTQRLASQLGTPGPSVDRVTSYSNYLVKMEGRVFVAITFLSAGEVLVLLHDGIFYEHLSLMTLVGYFTSMTLLGWYTSKINSVSRSVRSFLASQGKPMTKAE